MAGPYQLGGLSGGQAQQTSMPSAPTIYSHCVDALTTMDRIVQRLDEFASRLVGPTPCTGPADKAGPLPMQAVANRLAIVSEEAEKRLVTLLELMGGES